jgi:NAD(P)-dependent dehydrogenase (short-subunit alcohol dehydrogenase family)
MTASLSPMHGKILLITGGTSGIGLAAAEELARLGATTIIVGRTTRRCAATVRRLKRRTGNTAVHSLVADLSSQQQIRDISAQFANRFDHLDVLINNAGAYFMDRQITTDGLEMTFAVNHLAYFLLTNLLLDKLKASQSARIVVVSSHAHESGRLNFDDLQRTHHYERLEAYAQSKLANVLFAYELARRLKGTPLTVNALNPGSVATRLGSNNSWLRAKVRNLVRRATGTMRSPEQGARTLVYLAASPEVEGMTGCYFKDEKAIRSSDLSYDLQSAQRLWEASENLTRQRSRLATGSPSTEC